MGQVDEIQNLREAVMRATTHDVRPGDTVRLLDRHGQIVGQRGYQALIHAINGRYQNPPPPITTRCVRHPDRASITQAGQLCEECLEW